MPEMDGWFETENGLEPFLIKASSLEAAVLDKVFYSREKKPDYCWDCDGEGIVDVEVYRPHNVGRDVGVIDVKPMQCETCGGTGRVEVEDD